MKTKCFVAFVCALGMAASAWGADLKLDGVKCLLNPKADAKADKSADYKGGKVFFCCENCPKAFAKETSKHATKANHQLAATGQAKQTKCPLSGQAVDATKTTKVGGVDVAFCCDKCLAKAKDSKDAAVDLVFADKAFDQSFKVGK